MGPVVGTFRRVFGDAGGSLRPTGNRVQRIFRVSNRGSIPGRPAGRSGQRAARSTIRRSASVRRRPGDPPLLREKIIMFRLRKSAAEAATRTPVGNSPGALPWGGVDVPESDATSHFLAVGATGSGK